MQQPNHDYLRVAGSERLRVLFAEGMAFDVSSRPGMPAGATVYSSANVVVTLSAYFSLPPRHWQRTTPDFPRKALCSQSW